MLILKSGISLLAVAWASSALAVWDLQDDFSVTHGNPNLAWSYGIKNPSQLDGALSLFPDSGSNTSFMYWNDLNHLTLGTPAVAKNISGGVINGIAPGEVSLHPGPNNEITTVRWTAPTAGNFHFVGLFKAGDGGAVDNYVYQNGTALLTVMSTSADTNFEWNLDLTAGDTMDFMVGNAGSFYYDSTPLVLQIVPVPEPSSIVALVGAGSGFFLRRRVR